MNPFPPTFSTATVLPAPKQAPFDVRIVLLMILVGIADLCSGRKLFRST